MTLYWINYKNKKSLILPISSNGNKMTAIKIYENGQTMVSDSEIASIRRLRTGNNLFEDLKSILSNFSKIYRTYRINEIKILSTYPINP